MVLVRDLDSDVIRLHVRLRTYSSHASWEGTDALFEQAQLVPQLIINYKLKSVAHMPMKAMVYKTLSTVSVLQAFFG